MSRYQYFDHCPANRTLDNIIVKQSNYVPEQGTSLLQSCDISFGPTHALPPWAAGWLVHERERVFVPPPQVTLHSLQFPHVVQPPFTGEGKKDCSDNVHRREAMNCLSTWTHCIFVAVLCHFF